jgi:hypothetical protein
MAAHTKTAKAPRKRATGPSRAQESEPAKAAEQVPTETAPASPVKLSAGSTGLTIPEDKAKAVAALHIAGVPITRICEEVGISYHTAAALIRNRPELLEMARDVTAKNWKTLAALGTAQLVDRLPQMKDQALSVLSAIATEKAELLAGGATQRIEVIAAPVADEWGDIVEGVVIESSPSPMGNTGRTRAAKGQAAPAAVSAPRADGEQPPAIGPRYSDATDIVPEFEPQGAGFLPPAPPTGQGAGGVASSSRSTLPDSLSDDEIFHKRL